MCVVQDTSRGIGRTCKTAWPLQGSVGIELVGDLVLVGGMQQAFGR